MIRRPLTRPGTSLLEVLVGLGILAIGAISAFVLFPLSAINVSRAMIDDRATTCAITADGQLREIHRWSVTEPESQGGASTEPYHSRMDNPLTGPPALAPTDPAPSYPVVVDPMGIAAGRGAVGDAGETQVPRVSLNLITSANVALRFCSQMDGLSYNDGGQVAAPSQAEIRELRYNWMWVLQRPSNRDRYTVRQQVVVFDRRQHLFAPTGSELVLPGVTLTPGDTVVTGVPTVRTVGGQPVPVEIRKGSWVMDATISNQPDGDGVPRPKRHAEFYRVVSVTEVAGSPSTFTLELHRAVVRADGLVSLTAPNNFAYTGNLVHMPAVVEVFERPMLTGGFGP